MSINVQLIDKKTIIICIFLCLNCNREIENNAENIAYEYCPYCGVELIYE